MQAALDQLTQSNRDLLDLLKKQQAVLEDIQFDRRLQSRQIESLEERLEETLLQNAQLQNKVANLEADAAVRPSGPRADASAAGDATLATNAAARLRPRRRAGRRIAAATARHLPAAAGIGRSARHEIVAPAFHAEGRATASRPIFFISTGRTWRVLWHNQDKPGKDVRKHQRAFHQCLSQGRHDSAKSLRQARLGRRFHRARRAREITI